MGNRRKINKDDVNKRRVCEISWKSSVLSFHLYTRQRHHLVQWHFHLSQNCADNSICSYQHLSSHANLESIQIKTLCNAQHVWHLLHFTYETLAPTSFQLVLLRPGLHVFSVVDLQNEHDLLSVARFPFPKFLPSFNIIPNLVLRQKIGRSLQTRRSDGVLPRQL